MNSEEERTPTASRRLRRGLETSIVDNSSAFGFSIMITASFGALSTLARQPGLAEVFGFGLGAASMFTLLQAVSSGGFRHHVPAASRSVVMLGTALNMVSVAVGVGLASIVGALLPAGIAWPLGGFLAAGGYIVLEAVELGLAAALLRRRSGDGELDEDGE